MDKEIIDPIIGRLLHDGHYYNGIFKLNNSSGEFSIGTYQVEDLEARFERARKIFKSLDSVILQAKDYAANNLLHLKNDSWEEEDGRVIDLEEFRDRISISSVTVDHNNHLVLYFNDGDLFFGHHILVTADSNGQFNRAKIQG